MQHRFVFGRTWLDDAGEGLRVAGDEQYSNASSERGKPPSTYHKNPRLYSPSGMISFPSSSTSFLISKSARTFAMVNHIESSAMYCPGQMRLPNPNAATEGSRTSRFRVPSDRKKRSGLNSDVSRPYTFSSWRIALRAGRHQLQARGSSLW